MSSSYSEDEFEQTAGSLSLSAVSSEAAAPNTRQTPDDEEGGQRTVEGKEGTTPRMTVVLPKESVDADHDDDGAGVSEPGYSSFEDEDDEPSSPLISPSFTVGERDSRTTKQKYLDLKRKTATVWEEAKALAQRRFAEDSQLRLQAQQTKESWHKRIHRRHTELEWHRKLAAKTAQSVIDMALNREAWTRGVLCARAKGAALDQAFSSALASLQARTSEQDEAALAAERDKIRERAAACKTVWDASRYGVPVRTLRELMEIKIDQSRREQTRCDVQDAPSSSTSYDHSEPFEQLCRRVEGVVVESRHPYPKGVRQDVEAHVPNADCFYVAFDAASNATMGMGKIALQEFSARDPAVFYPRGPYNYGSSEAHLPGVNGEPPMRVEGSSLLITFSASYWTGVATAGEDYGWRLVCFTAKDSDDAKASVDLAESAADRAAAVDAVNVSGETCLHVASFEGNVAAVRYLLSADADPNSAHTSSGYNTPLHEAARSGSLDVTRLLLKSSANVLAANSHGDRPLHVACREGRLDIARRLLAHDSDWATVTARNHAGLRPSEVVTGCSALASLLQQAVSAVEISKANPAGGGSADIPPSSLKTKSHFRQNSNGVRRSDGGRALRRENKAGGMMTTSSAAEGAPARALLSGSILPRWARLARPLDEEQRRQRGPLDGRERRHHGLPPGVTRVARGASNTNVDTNLSEGNSSETQSFADWSGTSYGASLTDSDFEIPPADEVVGLAGDETGVSCLHE